jgi:hypothetical protein
MKKQSACQRDARHNGDEPVSTPDAIPHDPGVATVNDGGILEIDRVAAARATFRISIDGRLEGSCPQPLGDPLGVVVFDQPIGGRLARKLG